jgi:hypothetical protein
MQKYANKEYVKWDSHKIKRRDLLRTSKYVEYDVTSLTDLQQN